MSHQFLEECASDKFLRPLNTPDEHAAICRQALNTMRERVASLPTGSVIRYVAPKWTKKQQKKRRPAVGVLLHVFSNGQSYGFRVFDLLDLREYVYSEHDLQEVQVVDGNAIRTGTLQEVTA